MLSRNQVETLNRVRTHWSHINYKIRCSAGYIARLACSHAIALVLENGLAVLSHALIFFDR